MADFSVQLFRGDQVVVDADNLASRMPSTHQLYETRNKLAHLLLDFGIKQFTIHISPALNCRAEKLSDNHQELFVNVYPILQILPKLFFNPQLIIMKRRIQ